MYLAYYNTDDGIWLVCGDEPGHRNECGWEINLGMWPTVVEVHKAQVKHMTEHVYEHQG